MRCASGCDRCCHQRLTITAVEAAAIQAWASTLPAERRVAIAAVASATDLSRCAALDEAGRCGIYDARPIVCRSHGVPIRMRDERRLPVVTSCELNFGDRGPAAVDADCILDQELVSTMLGLVDREFAGTASPPERVDLAGVLASLAP